MSYLSDEQVEKLLRPIHPRRVSQRDGLSHLEAYDVRAHLTRIFGFGRWSADLVGLDMLYEHPSETSAGKAAFSVAYRAIMRLTVCAPDGTVLATYTEAATGDAKMPESKRGDAHDFAIKTAESQAFKRCAINLGDQFGLSLYQRGSRDALIGQTLVGSAQVSAASVDEHVVEVTPEHGGEAQPDTTSAVSGQATPPRTSTTAPVEPPAPAAPPASSPDGAAQQAAEVAKLREASLALFTDEFGGTRQDAIVKLGRIKIQAAKQALLNEPVRMETGEEVTVNVFLDDLIKRLSRAAA